MSETTDPARELVELCAKLQQENLQMSGEQVLAKQFDVQPWSSEFFQILFTIVNRIRELDELINKLEIADDLKRDAAQNLEQIRQAFTPSRLQSAWQNAVTTNLTPANLAPIKMLSSHFVKICPYPKLTADEVKELLDQTEELHQWLDAHQLTDQDFIRQALLDGLTQFRFRLARVGWLGWGYTLQSLREVIAAYMALERCAADPNSSPIETSILIKTKSLIVSVFEKANWLKQTAELGDFVLKAYGATTLAIHGHQTLAGFLTYVAG